MNVKKTISVLLMAAAFVSITGVADAALKDFKEGTEKSGSTRDRSSKKSAGGDNGCMGEAMDFCLGIAGALWISHNLSLYYSSYPYEKTGPPQFIYHLSGEKEEEAPGILEKKISPGGDIDVDELSSGKNGRAAAPGFDHTWYLNIDMGGQYTRDSGSGGFVGLSGKIFRLLGPECEFKRMVDNGDRLDYLAAGVNISLFQFNYFSTDFYLQYAGMKGVVDLSGYAYGLIVHSYPFKPVHILLRIGMQSYTEKEAEDIYREIDFLDLEGRVGVMIYRCEIFAGYRHVETDHAELGGPIGGVRIWF
ncbi:MAG TPA: hypothetical protein ENN21_03215 [Spirochaetes bacterium]|nr:hypothetical protein [Spirochaetota bacterium]